MLAQRKLVEQSVKKYKKLNLDDEIITYPENEIRLIDFRYEEVRLSCRPANQQGSTFMDLFGHRMKKVKGEKQKVSVILDVTINTRYVFKIKDKTIKEYENKPKKEK